MLAVNQTFAGCLASMFTLNPNSSVRGGVYYLHLCLRSLRSPAHRYTMRGKRSCDHKTQNSNSYHLQPPRSFASVSLLLWCSLMCLCAHEHVWNWSSTKDNKEFASPSKGKKSKIWFNLLWRSWLITYNQIRFSKLKKKITIVFCRCYNLILINYQNIGVHK